MRLSQRLISISAASAVILSLTMFAAQARDISDYTEGGTPVVYGQRLVLDTCSNLGPQSGIALHLWAKESGKWVKVATATNRKSKRCPYKRSPYLHTYKWVVDVLGKKVSPLRYELELGYGKSPSASLVFVVPQYRNKSGLTQHYACLVVHNFDPVATDLHC